MEIDWNALNKGVLNLYNTFSGSLGLTLFFLILFYLIFYLWAFSLTDTLFRVHRSKTACKKIMKEYTFWQKVVLIPQKKHCLHAKKFCNKIINYLYTHTVFFVFSLIFIIAEHLIFTKLTVSFFVVVVQFLAFMIPLSVAEIILEEKPWLRFNKRYRFEKYHHTKEFEKLI